MIMLGAELCLVCARGVEVSHRTMIGPYGQTRVKVPTCVRSVLWKVT